MATLKIPEDVEQRNIIDKLANFVARNGPKFEDLTKSKQKDSPKFSFLFGGDYHEYYKWKVTLETSQVEAQKQQEATAAAQNAAQNRPIAPPPSEPVCKENGAEKDPSYLDLATFQELVQKLILACTKDNIQNGKNWIVNNAKTDIQRKKVAQFLFRRLLEEVLPFQQKLHIVYLANDVLHHSRKKDLPHLQESLQEYILPIIGIVVNGETAENKQKISKVLKIWENQSFFNEEIREQLKDPSPLYDKYLNIIDNEKAEMKKEKYEEEEKIRDEQEDKERSIDELLERALPLPVITQQQHPPHQPPLSIQSSQDQQSYLYQQPPPQNYSRPPPSQGISQLPPQQSAAPPVSSQPPPPGPPQGVPQGSSQGPPPQGQPYQQYQQYGGQQWNQQQQPPSQQPPQGGQQDQYHYYNQSYQQRPPQETFDQEPRFPPPYQQQGFPPQGPRDHLHGEQGYDQGPGGPNWSQSYDMPPPHSYQSAPPPSIQTFDYSHQSVPNQGPGDAPISIDYEHGRAPIPDPKERDPTIPLAHYYDLPAGLIVPLVKLWDCEYKPIDPKDIRLPIPQPPSERLLAAVEAFYAPPSHDRPRDSQGWEKNGLFEFYKAKIKYIKDKERKVEVIHRTPSPPASRSSSPESEGLVTTRPLGSRSPSRSPLRQKSKSRSRSGSRERKGSRSRSRTRSRSASHTPKRKGSRSKSRSYSRSPSPKKQPIPVQRSPTPPAEFIGFEHKSLDTRLDESNIGHKMLAKMGWGGQGLGKKETGIVDPIKQDAVRDKQDKYKGIGIDVDDPFESYRKNKSYTYSRPRDRRRGRGGVQNVPTIFPP